MNDELQHMYHPWKIRLFWAAVYSVIIILLVSGVYLAMAQFRTHTLPVGQVQLAVPYSKYIVGETISFSIKNNYNSPIYIANNCPSEPLAVYRQENNIWVRQHDTASQSECPDEQRQVSVPANGISNGNFAPWHNLFSQPGKYRVVAFVEYYNALPYQEFEILAKPEPAAVVPLTEQKSPLTQQQTPNDQQQAQPTQAISPKPPKEDAGD